MSRRAMAVVAGAAIVGAVLFVGVQEAAEDDQALTQWGEPDLAGVWQGEVLGAAAGRHTYNLTTLEGLYTSDARARMRQLSATDDPTLECVPPAFRRAAMPGHRLQIIGRPSTTRRC